MKPGSKRQYFTRTKCGRAAREKGNNIRCWDGKKMNEEGEDQKEFPESKSHIKIKVSKKV